MVRPALASLRTTRVKSGNQCFRSHLARFTQGSNVLLRHIQIQSPFVLPLTDLNNSISITRVGKLDLVAPVLHRVDDCQQKSNQATHGIRILRLRPVANPAADVAVRKIDAPSLLDWMIGVRFLQVHCECWMTGQWGIEKVKRHVASDAAIGKPDPGCGQYPRGAARYSRCYGTRLLFCFRVGLQTP